MDEEIQKSVAKELGIEGLTLEEQRELIVQMTGVMLKAANLAILEKLPDGKREEFVAIADTRDETALREFLMRELPDSEAIVRAAVAEEVRRFREGRETIPTA